jgi:hypothetical protein
MLWGRIFNLDFAYISQKFPSDPVLFFYENEEISAPLPSGFLIGIYLFYENWSTGSFRKSQNRTIGTFVRDVPSQVDILT